MQVSPGAPISESYREAVARVCGLAFLPPRRLLLSSSGTSARGVAATCSAWNRGTAGASPAALTNFNLLPWSNTSGIRLLNGTMQVRILPAAPLPGSVKVARRPVKPFGVGASPTLAANFWKAGRYKLAAPVLKTGSASPRSERYPVAVCKDPSAILTINPQEITMTLNQYLPPWLVRKLTKPRPRRITSLQMKRRQILPTLPKARKSFGRK